MDCTPAICTHIALEFQGSSPSAMWLEPAALWKCKLCGPAQAGWQPWLTASHCPPSNCWAVKHKDFRASLTLVSWSQLDHNTEIVLPPASAI